MKKFSVLWLSLLLVITAACSEESKRGLSSEASFASLDVNQDGVIDKLEANGDRELANSWSSADLDQDGAISSQEFTIYAGESTAAGQEVKRDMDTQR